MLFYILLGDCNVSIFLSILATIGISINFVISDKSDHNTSVTKWFIFGTILAISMVWWQFYNHHCESGKMEQNHQELKDMLAPVLSLAKSLNPELDNKAAIISLLAELEEVLEQNRRKSIINYVVPGGGIIQAGGGAVTYDPGLISALSNLLNQDDPSVKKAAEACLQAIGTDDALKAIQEHTSK